MLIVGPDCPAALRPLMTSVVEAIRALQEPGKPVRLPSVPTAATLPAAGSWPNCTIICAAINAQVTSTLVGSTWTWLRADGSAL